MRSTKKTVGCLARQSNELQFAVGIELPSSDELFNQFNQLKLKKIQFPKSVAGHGKLLKILWQKYKQGAKKY
jgi:hypothetical protein